MSQSNILIYRTGDFRTPEEAYNNGALYEMQVDCNSEHISTPAGFDLYDIITAIEVTARMFGYSANEYEIVFYVDGEYLTCEQYETAYGDNNE